MAYWLVKTEPEVYSYDDLERAGRDMWDGVRNHTAKNHLNSMAPGEQVFIYHSGKERAIVGVAEVVSQPYPDPTEPSGKWVTVDMVPIGRLRRPISLAEVKQFPELADWELVRISRLSVMPVPPTVWEMLTQLAST